jgi:hypothetical protein
MRRILGDQCCGLHRKCIADPLRLYAQAFLIVRASQRLGILTVPTGLGRMAWWKHKYSASQQGEQNATAPTIESAFEQNAIAPETKSVFEQMPFDVLLYISAFLDPASLASLVLTTRGLYEMYTRHASTPLVPDQNDRRSLLHLIEHDRPFLLRCTGCHKLYECDWRLNPLPVCYYRGCPESRRQACDAVLKATALENESASIEKSNELIGISCAGMDWAGPETVLDCVYEREVRNHYQYLTPAIRDLVLRYENYKDLDHGIPMQQLDHDCIPTQETFDSVTSNSLSIKPNSMKIAACIAGDSLLLRYERRYDVIYSKTQAWWPRNACSSERVFCRHQVDHLSNVVEFIMSTGALRDLRCQSIYLHCDSCPTDWLVTIAAVGDTNPETGENSFEHLGEDRRLHKVWLTAWHDLGTRSESTKPVFDETLDRTFQWPNHAPRPSFDWTQRPRKDRCLAEDFRNNYHTGINGVGQPQAERRYVEYEKFVEVSAQPNPALPGRTMLTKTSLG